MTPDLSPDCFTEGLKTSGLTPDSAPDFARHPTWGTIYSPHESGPTRLRGVEEVSGEAVDTLDDGPGIGAASVRLVAEQEHDDASDNDSDVGPGGEATARAIGFPQEVDLDIRALDVGIVGRIDTRGACLDMRSRTRLPVDVHVAPTTSAYHRELDHRLTEPTLSTKKLCDSEHVTTVASAKSHRTFSHQRGIAHLHADRERHADARASEEDDSCRTV